MADLVREHRRDLSLAVGRGDQAGVDVDPPAADAEGVHPAVGYDSEAIAELRAADRAGQSASEVLNVVLDLRIAHHSLLGLDLAGELLSDFGFLLDGQQVEPGEEPSEQARVVGARWRTRSHQHHEQRHGGGREPTLRAGHTLPVRTPEGAESFAPDGRLLQEVRCRRSPSLLRTAW